MSFTHNLIARRRDEEEGFTLIELMVVVLIIAILIAIAIPTFLGARQRAQDRAAQSDLRNALTTEKTFYTDAQSYTATTATLQGIESSLKWGTKVIVAPTLTNANANDSVCIEEKSASGTMFAVGDVSAGTGAGTYFQKDTTGASLCGTATVATITAWPSSW